MSTNCIRCDKPFIIDPKSADISNHFGVVVAKRKVCMTCRNELHASYFRGVMRRKQRGEILPDYVPPAKPEKNYGTR